MGLQRQQAGDRRHRLGFRGVAEGECAVFPARQRRRQGPAARVARWFGEIPLSHPVGGRILRVAAFFDGCRGAAPGLVNREEDGTEGEDGSTWLRTTKRTGGRLPTTTPRTSRSSKGSRRCASARRCTSATPASRGLHHLVYEVVDNSHRRGAWPATATDDRGHRSTSTTRVHGRRQRPRHPGRHAPDGEGVSAAEVVLTKLHAGGKFDNDALQGLGRPARRRRLGGQRAVGVARARDPARRQGLSRSAIERGKPVSAARRRSARPSRRGTKVTLQAGRGDLRGHRVQLRHALASACASWRS